MLWTQLFLVISLSGALKSDNRPRSTSARRPVPSGRHTQSAFQPPNLLPPVEGSARGRSSSRTRGAVDIGPVPERLLGEEQAQKWVTGKKHQFLNQLVGELASLEPDAWVVTTQFEPGGTSEVYVAIGTKRKGEGFSPKRKLEQVYTKTQNSLTRQGLETVEGSAGTIKQLSFANDVGGTGLTGNGMMTVRISFYSCLQFKGVWLEHEARQQYENRHHDEPIIVKCRQNVENSEEYAKLYETVKTKHARGLLLQKHPWNQVYGDDGMCQKSDFTIDMQEVVLDAIASRELDYFNLAEESPSRGGGGGGYGGGGPRQLAPLAGAPLPGGYGGPQVPVAANTHHRGRRHHLTPMAADGHLHRAA